MRTSSGAGATTTARRAALADASGDTLDAIACAVQAAWGALRAGANYGLPGRAADAEGWIVTA